MTENDVIVALLDDDDTVINVVAIQLAIPYIHHSAISGAQFPTSVLGCKQVREL